MTTVLALVAAIAPFAVVVGLLSLASRRERVQQQAVAHQAAITSAIHGELGAVVAPVVTPGRRGSWRIAIGVPLGHPGLVAAVLAIVDRRLVSRAGDSRARFEIVLTPREEMRSALALPPTRRVGPMPSRRGARPEASQSWT